MDAETLIWTLILFGGTVAICVGLVVVALRKDEQHLHDD